MRFSGKINPNSFQDIQELKKCQGGPMTPYETARNRLIPHATRHADKTCGKKPWANKVEWAIKWNQAYLAEMDRLVKFTRITEGGWTIIELLFGLGILAAIGFWVGVIYVGWHFASKYW